MKKAFSILLIIIGSFLEIWYYIIRFERDGIEFWLSAIMGVSLTLLLSVLVLLRQHRTWPWLLMLPLIVYSVLATSSGQSFHLSQLEKTETVDIAKNENLHELIKETRSLKTQYESERKQITVKINAIGVWSRQNLYAEEIQKLEQRRDFLDTEIIRLQTVIDKDSRSVEITDEIKKEKTETSYEFYERLTGIQAQMSQFILQTLLSIFFAIMAPVGITLIQSIGGKPEPKKRRQRIMKKKLSIAPEKIRRWVQVCWSGARTGKSQNIVPEKSFIDFVTARGEDFTHEEYQTLLRHAQRRNIVDKSRIIEHNEIEATRRISESLQ